MCSHPDASKKSGTEVKLVVRDEPEGEVSFEGWVHGQWDPIVDIKPEYRPQEIHVLQVASKGMEAGEEVPEEAPSVTNKGVITRSAQEPVESSSLADEKWRLASRCPKCSAQFRHVWAMLSHMGHAHKVLFRSVERQYDRGGQVISRLAYGGESQCPYCSFPVRTVHQGLLHVIDQHMDRLHTLPNPELRAEKLVIKVVIEFLGTEADKETEDNRGKDLYTVSVSSLLRASDPVQ